MPSIPLKNISIEWNTNGVTREVLLAGKYAFKFPKISHGWKFFLCGLIANMQELGFSKLNSPQLCPVIFAIPGGWLLVMKRAKPLNDEEWESLDTDKFVNNGSYSYIEDGKIMEGHTIIPVENKRDSFGVLDGRIVAVDYGT